MKLRTLGLLAVTATTVDAVPVTADAGSARDRATGGGQLVLATGGSGGALDTFAFTAQTRDIDNGTTNPATGQVQVVRRSNGTKFHGVVTCLAVFGGGKSMGKAYISGYQRDTEDDPVPFEAYVVDGGAGTNERGADQGMVWYGDETEDNEPDQQAPGGFTPPEEDSYCGIEEDPKNEVALARGNYQVYDGTAGEPEPDPQQRSASASTAGLTSLAGLR